MQPHDVAHRTESLATIMALTVDENIQDEEEEDRVATPNGDKYLYIDRKFL